MICLNSAAKSYCGWLYAQDQLCCVHVTLSSDGSVDPSSLKGDRGLIEVLRDLKDKKWFIDRVAAVPSVDDLPSALEDIIAENDQRMSHTAVISSDIPSHLMSEIDAIGWDSFVSMGEDLRTLKVCVSDSRNRRHDVEFSLPHDYPFGRPSVSVSLPFTVEFEWKDDMSISYVLRIIRDEISKFDSYFDVLDDLDHNAVILEPNPPSFSVPSRRIALTRTSSVRVVISPTRPLEVCSEVVFLGPPEEVAELRASLGTNMHRWSTSRLVRENLEDLLGIKLPVPKYGSQAGQNEFSNECGICYSYSLSTDTLEGKPLTVIIPDQVCPNIKCARVFHFDCLVSWLQSVPTNKSSFGTLFGNCPYCQEAISARTFH